jgi:signal transduction histidine kinase
VTSHELKTPLGGIKLLQLLLGKNSEILPGEDFKQMNETADDVYERLERIANATSLYNDLTSGAPIPFLNVDLGNILRGVVEKTRTEILTNGRRLTVTLDIPGGSEGRIVVGNEPLICQAFEELLSNAIKYTADDKNINVKLEAAPKGTLVAITDEGVGIPHESLDLLFQPFFSIENIHHHSTGAFKYLGGGIGLGLTLAKLIIDYQGGKLTLTSGGANKGTCVTITFPHSPA